MLRNIYQLFFFYRKGEIVRMYGEKAGKYCNKCSRRKGSGWSCLRNVAIERYSLQCDGVVLEVDFYALVITCHSSSHDEFYWLRIALRSTMLRWDWMFWNSRRWFVHFDPHWFAHARVVSFLGFCPVPSYSKCCWLWGPVVFCISVSL